MTILPVPALERVPTRGVAELRPLAVADARRLVLTVPDSAVRAELDEEEQARDLRRMRRENRGGSGRLQQCGGCHWVVRNTAQPCPRCGYTNGYGYPR